MSSNNGRITVLHGGHRHTLEFPRTIRIAELSAMACTKFGAAPGSLVLRHPREKKPVDASATFAHSGLQQNVLLELVPGGASASAPVRVALSGGGAIQRLVHSFPCSATLSDVLSHWAAAGSLPADTLQRSPSIVFTRQNVPVTATLQSLVLLGRYTLPTEIGTSAPP